MAPRLGTVKPPPFSLTARQAAVLRTITAAIDKHGRPPTLREIGAATGIRSTNGVADHLRALERKGLIERDPCVARNIRVLGRGKRKESSAGRGRGAAESEAAMERTLKVGDPVIFTDEVRVDRFALVTCIHAHGTFEEHVQRYGTPPCINLVFVSGDDAKRDDYGRQVERKTSITYRTPSQQVAGGFFYRFLDEQ
jgi:hypothetical protein